MSTYSTTRYEVWRVAVNGRDVTVEEGFDALDDAKAEARKLLEDAPHWQDGRTYEVVDTLDNIVVWKAGWL